MFHELVATLGAAVALPAATSEDTQEKGNVPETKSADPPAVDSPTVALSALRAPLIGRNYMMRQAL